jgi:hypothetical protein
VPEVHAAWVASLPPGTQRQLTQTRRKAIQARLREFGLDDCLAAAVGWRDDPWPGRAEQNDITILFRPGNFERMRDFARDGPPSRAAPLGRRTEELVRNAEQLRAVGIAKGVIGNGVAPVGGDRRQAQRELERPADRGADCG